MCGPAAAFLVVSMALTAASAVQQSRAANAQAAYEKQVQQNNDIMAQRAQEDALSRGRREETLRRMQTQQDVGAAKSKLAAGGFNVNTGSALTYQSDVAAQGDIEALTIRNNAQREAYGIGVENYGRQAESRSRIAASKNQAKSSLITGATQVASLGYSGYSTGAFGKK